VCRNQAWAPNIPVIRAALKTPANIIPGSVSRPGDVFIASASIQERLACGDRQIQ
jgi:hypothetical protein